MNTLSLCFAVSCTDICRRWGKKIFLSAYGKTCCPARVGGRLVGITGHTAADENRLYGKNGVSLHPISGETR